MVECNVGTSQALAVTSALAVFAIAATWWYQKKKQPNIPESWKVVGKVKQLFLYPLKSGRKIELNRGECTGNGIKQLKTDSPDYQLRDRQLLVYNESNNEFRTGRQFPKLLLIELAVQDEDQFVLNAPGMNTLIIPIPKLGQRKADQITFFHDEKVTMTDCGNEAARWLSKYLLEKDNGLRLGFNDGEHPRNIMGSYKKFIPIYKNLNNNSAGLYSDLTSFLLVNQSSVDDLTSRIPNSDVTFENFRPNILVEKAAAFDEDNWDWIKIGDAVFRRMKPCTRCILTTINPETGVKESSGEPLTTLRTYRLCADPKERAVEGNSPVMGVNLGLIKPGIITTNDVIYVAKSNN